MYAMIRRNFLVSAVCAFALTAWGASSSLASIEADARGFVQTVTDEVVRIISDPALGQSGRKEAFEVLLTDKADVQAIGRFVAGRYWRQADKQIQTSYLEAFTDYVAFTYAAQLEGYSGEQLEIGRVVDRGKKGVLVETQINRSNGAPPVSVDWRLQPNGDGFKIIDMIVERVSMALTQRTEFQESLQRNGGNLGALAAELKAKAGA